MAGGAPIPRGASGCGAAARRRQIPAGWTEASDQTCLDVMERLPAPPRPAPGKSAAPGPTDDSFRLLQRASRLTIFTDGADVAPGSGEGFTVSLSRTADGKFARLDGPTYGCGGPEIDQAAVAFDAP